MNSIAARIGCALVVLSLTTGCWSYSGPEVVVYTALDREFSEPVLNEFERDTGVHVMPKYDVESTKTVGLVNAIIQEQSRPRCDVFWNNEILHTLRLERLGLLETYMSPAAKNFPRNYVSPDGKWHGLAARARVLIVNTEAMPDPNEWPNSVFDLADPRWKGQVAIAKPLFGTTATHAAVLFAELGDRRAREFFHKVKQNAAVLSGNKQVATAVAQRRFKFGVTDTDDAVIERDKGFPVEIIYPDQGQDGMGTLFIPNTLCIIRGGGNTVQARRLVDYLLQPRIEIELATGPSAQFPVNPAVEVRPRVEPAPTIRWMDVDFDAAAQQWNTAYEFLREEFHNDP